MPFTSKAQARFMFARHPKIAKRWAKHTKDIKSLPKKVSEHMHKMPDGHMMKDSEMRIKKKKKKGYDFKKAEKKLKVVYR